MQTLLITLVGEQYSVDLQVPGEVPLKNLLPAFVKIHGSHVAGARGTDPSQWSVGHKAWHTPLDPGRSLLDAGIVNGTTLVLREKAEGTTQTRAAPAPKSTAHAPTSAFHVPVRDYPPRLSNDEIVINAPPQVQPAQGGLMSVLQILMPILGVMGGSLFFLIYFVDGSMGGAAGRWMLVIAIAMPVLMIASTLSTSLIQKWVAKKQRKYAHANYLEYLAAWRTRLQKLASVQHGVSERLYPDLSILAKNVVDRQYLWERRPGDRDFLSISLGSGPAPLSCPISLNLGPDPMVKYELDLRTKAEALVAQYHHLEDEPAVVSLLSAGVLAITGKRAITLPLVRAMLCQVVAFHSPSDVRCAAFFPAHAAAQWSWLKWLPHTQRLRHVKVARPQDGEVLCLLGDSLADCQMVLATQIMPELELRRKLSEAKREEDAKAMLPHLIIVIDGYVPGGALAQLPELEDLFSQAAALGVTILCILDEKSREPAETRARIVPSQGDWIAYEVTAFAGRRLEGILPATASLETCDLIARSLATITPAGDDAENDLSQDVRLLDLLDIPAVETLQPAKAWTTREREALLRIPLGKREKGKSLLLDLKESADKGDGPHGLVIGATGSGKSELLRTLVISEAILHDPGTVNFVFVDFKGGASFADLAALPHVAGMITNLENEPALLDRMVASLLGELRRRQRMLREAGNLDNIQQYRAWWQEHQREKEPMPHLLLIVDEFAEMLANRPDFLDLFITVGRVGRSLGFHLLLATQRLEEGRLKGLESYLRYRICLRTFSPGESTTVLGRPDAYYLPSSPGIGYLKIDTNNLIRFKTALVTVPYRPGKNRISPTDLVYTFTNGGKLIPYELDESNPISAHLAAAGQTEMDIVIERLADPALSRKQAPVHQVWLPPLPKQVKLETVMNRKFDGSFWHTAPPFGSLCVPVGLRDVPLEQKQEPLLLDFSGSGGHLALVGAPQSGKSTLLRTLLLSFMVTHSPRDVQFYCIDLGGGQLRPLEAFPHVGAVCVKADRDKIRLLMRLMNKIIADREVLFRDHNIESMASFRMRRQAGEFASFPFGDVFLVIDNMAQLQHDFEQIEAELVNLVTVGLTYGVHIVVATNRWPELRPKLRDNIGTRLELRLNDPIESEIDKRKSAELPAGVPGRGITRDKLQFQTCLPWIDIDDAYSAHNQRSQQEALQALGDRMKLWRGAAALPVLVLPTRITRQEMRQYEKPGHAGVSIGLEEFRLDPAYVDLISRGPHFLVLGDAECGKTNLIRLWASELTRRYTPEQVRIAAIECRATTNLVGLAQGEHSLTYASMRMPASLKESVEVLTNTLKERSLPTAFTSIKDLANAKTWEGPHYFLFIDDYDAIASPSGNPLTPLRDVLLQAREIGFHLVLTRTVSGFGSSSFEPIMKTLREMGGPGLIMSGDRLEGKLLHEQMATSLPTGRGYLVQRRYPPALIQIALAE